MSVDVERYNRVRELATLALEESGGGGGGGPALRPEDEALRAEVEALVALARGAESDGFLDPERASGAPAAPASTAHAPLAPAPTVGWRESAAALANAARRVGRLDRYELGPVIGVGGAGVVHRARQLFPVEREVAVKIMHGAGAGRRARFELERAALARLDHPGVARVLDAGVTDDGHAYTVMDLARGEPLDRFCREQGLDRRGVVGLLVGVCEAVEHAHQRGVIHRDLKPSNVLARREDGAVRVTVVDFGTAALADAATRVTEADGPAPATLAYTPPERLRGDAPPDTRADVYALGAILYELLTGRPPHAPRGASAADVLAALGREPEPPLRPATGPGERDLNAVCLKALRQSPAQRYESVAAMREDLQRWGAGLGVRARHASRAERALRLARRHWRPLGAATLALGACAGLTAWALHARAEADQRRAELSGTLEAISGGVLERVSVLSGAYQARRGLANAMLGPLERLARERPDDDGAAHALAKVREELADIEMGAANGAAALPLRERVLAYWEARAAGRPATVRDARDHAEAVVKLGNAHETLGLGEPAGPARDASVARARALYERAQAALLSALDRWPDEPGLLDDLCYSAARLGAMDLRAGRLEEGARAYEQRLALALRLLEREPDDPMRRHNVNNAHVLLARTHMEAARPAEALAHARRGWEGAQALARDHPERAQFLMEVVIAAIYVADALHALGDAPGADDAARGAMPLAARVYTENGGRAEVAWIGGAMHRLLPEEWARALRAVGR